MLLFPIFVGCFVGSNFEDLIMRTVVARTWNPARNMLGVLIEELLVGYKMLFFLEEFDGCIFFLDGFFEAVGANARGFSFPLLDFDLVKVGLFDEVGVDDAMLR